MPQPVQYGSCVGLRGRSVLADEREAVIVNSMGVLVECMVD